VVLYTVGRLWLQSGLYANWDNFLARSPRCVLAFLLTFSLMIKSRSATSPQLLLLTHHAKEYLLVRYLPRLTTSGELEVLLVWDCWSSREELVTRTTKHHQPFRTSSSLPTKWTLNLPKRRRSSRATTVLQ
jgi:hypothetical protein